MSSPSTAVDIRVRDRGGVWTAPSSHGYVNEAELQRILCEQPSLIEGISAGAIAVTELTMSVGRADLVIVDTDGTITVVECKLRRTLTSAAPSSARCSTTRLGWRR